MSIPIDAVRAVAQLLQESGLHEIVVESAEGGSQSGSESRDSFRLKMRRDAPRPKARKTPASPKPGVATDAQTQSSAALSVLEVIATAVGIYQEPAKPLNIGDEVARKQVVAIVESLKIPNEITAPARARIVEILAQPGRGVEYGEVLLRLEPIVEETA